MSIYSTPVAALAEGISPTHWLCSQVGFTTKEPEEYNSVIEARKDWRVGRKVQSYSGGKVARCESRRSYLAVG